MVQKKYQGEKARHKISISCNNNDNNNNNNNNNKLLNIAVPNNHNMTKTITDKQNKY
jgi:hypothetical protein